MHGIERDDAVRDMELAEQLLRGGDFVDFTRCCGETGHHQEGNQGHSEHPALLCGC